MLLNKYDASVILAHKCASSTKCGAKLLLFIQLTKYFMYFCSKYLIHWSLNYKKKVEIMKKKSFQATLTRTFINGHDVYCFRRSHACIELYMEYQK